ncbi:protein KRI1 homolog [Ammospiza maritima maritima]
MAELRVNAAFAERYGRYRRREELQRREAPGTGRERAGNGDNRANKNGKPSSEGENGTRNGTRDRRERVPPVLIAPGAGLVPVPVPIAPGSPAVRDRYGDTADSGDSSSSESSGDDVALDPREEREFYRTLALLKTRDPRIYRQDTAFYTGTGTGIWGGTGPRIYRQDTAFCTGTGPDEDDDDDDDDDDNDDDDGDEERARPMFLKDYERKVVLEHEGKYVDEEDEEDEEAAAKRRKAEASPSYAEEQRALKESFRAFVAESEDEEDDDDGGGGGALLRPRERSREEKAQEQQQYLRWLRGQAEPPPEPLQDLEPLQRFWSDPALEPGERFLRDYLLGNGFREEQEEEEGEEGAALPPLDDSSDEGEQFLQRQQDFERRHNFRFEEPGAAQLQSFPRSIPSSVRRRDERRRERREQLRERRRKERARRREELKQLKKLKLQELRARLARIREASGAGAFGLSLGLLQEDFDPARHDQIMNECFGDDYYGRGEEEKPQFEEEEGPVCVGPLPNPVCVPPPPDDWNWDTWTGQEEEEEGEEEEGEPPREPHCEDPDFVMDADFAPGAPPGRDPPPEGPGGRRRRRGRLREALEREKPPFDPARGPFEQYLDEFYALDFEDLIGDLPCRFKYRRVLPCDFGLSTDEILAADDKELNRWCSLRKTCMYRSEQEERQDQANYQRRAQNLSKKHQILRSLVADPEEEEAAAPAKPKFGKKHREKRKRQEGKGEPPATPPANPQTPGGPRRRGGAPLGPAVRLGGREFSGRRLEAFGLNARRLRMRQLRRERGRGNGGKDPGNIGQNPGKNPGKNEKNPGKNPGKNEKNPGNNPEKNSWKNPEKNEKNPGKNPEKNPGENSWKNHEKSSWKNPGQNEKNPGKTLGKNEKNPGKNPGENPGKNPGKNSWNNEKNPKKNAGKDKENPGKNPEKPAAVNGKKQKRRKNAPNPQENT